MRLVVVEGAFDAGHKPSTLYLQMISFERALTGSQTNLPHLRQEPRDADELHGDFYSRSRVRG